MEMTEQQIETLWNRNAAIFTQMEVTAGTVVKTILLTAEKNGPAYVRLFNPTDSTVEYEMVEGDQSMIKKCCEAIAGSGAYSDTKLRI